MKPAYRASATCRMKRSADPRSGTSSVSTPKLDHLVNYSISHTSCETKSFWAMGYFSLGKCAALAAVVAGSRRRCGMERAVHTGVDWKVPPVSAPHRDMELKVPTKPGRRAMALHDPVQPETKPVVLFPGGLFKPPSVSSPGMPELPDCASSRLS